MREYSTPSRGLGTLMAALALHAMPLQAADAPVPVYDIEAQILAIQNEAPAIHYTSMEALAKAPGVAALSAPRIRVRAGQEAEIHVGEDLQYMERRDDGTFVLKTLSGDASAGIRLGVKAEPNGEDRAELTMDLSIAVMEERAPIPGVELDIGLPMLRTTDLNTRVVAAHGEWVKVAGRAFTDVSSEETERLVVMVKVSLVPPGGSE